MTSKEPYSHCHYCGAAYAEPSARPQSCSVCGQKNYFNPTPVAVVVQPVDDGLLLIKRAQGHGKSLLAFPGGYVDLNETWQEAAARELKEETGISINPADLEIFDIQSGGIAKNRLMIFGLSKVPLTSAELPPFIPNAEVSQRLVVNTPVALAFNTHEQVLVRYFKTKAAQPQPVTVNKGAIKMNELKINGILIKLTGGNIVSAGTAAIVNAANSGLGNGSGVTGAIFEAAGSALDRYTATMGGCPTGEAKITPAFKISDTNPGTSHIIHAVGPVYNASNPDKSDQLLANAYRASLELAEKHNLKSIAFPSISTGIYHFPLERAAPIALNTVIDFLKEKPRGLQEVQFVLWGHVMEIYEELLAGLNQGK